MESNAPPHKKYTTDRELIKAIEDIALEWRGEETRVCVNRNVCCGIHKDGSKGRSYSCGWASSQQVLWCLTTRPGSRKNTNGNKINVQTHRWNEPHEGDKYSVIVYMGDGREKEARLNSHIEATEGACHYHSVAYDG